MTRGVHFLSVTLKEELAELIRKEKRITFSDWMETALYHPTLGYYNRPDHERWGRKGDYRTSPESSELFARTFASYFLTLYQKLNSSRALTILEIGGGDGSFASVFLDSLAEKAPEVFRSTRYVFVEASVDARARSAQRLQRFQDQVQYADFGTISPVEAAIVFSNELLDAFPVHRVTRVEEGLRELFVALDDQSEFVWTSDHLSSSELEEFCHKHLPSLAVGQIVEVNLKIKDWFSQIAHIVRNGFVITVDYGAEADLLYDSVGRNQGTLRGFKNHQFVEDVLRSPGENDITSTIDWTYVIAEGKEHGFIVEDFSRLDQFLLNVGILNELQVLLESETSEANQARITTAAREMILPSGMASTFQVLVQKR